MHRIVEGSILESSSGKRCVIVFDNNLKYDLLFSQGFQMKDVPLENILREYRLVGVRDKVIDAIEEICGIDPHIDRVGVLKHG